MKKLILLGVICLCVNTAFAQGKYVKDGRTYEANSQFFDRFDSFIKTTNRELWPYFADVRNALLKGATVTYDSFECALSDNVNFHLLNERQIRKMRKNGIIMTKSRVMLAKLMIQKLAEFNP